MSEADWERKTPEEIARIFLDEEEEPERRRLARGQLYRICEPWLRKAALKASFRATLSHYFWLEVERQLPAWDRAKPLREFVRGRERLLLQHYRDRGTPMGIDVQHHRRKMDMLVGDMGRRSLEEVLREEPAVEADLGREERRVALGFALAQLEEQAPDEARLVIEVFMQGRTQREVGRELGLSDVETTRLKQRALSHLARLMGERHEEP